jgi:hypothetical protein
MPKYKFGSVSKAKLATCHPALQAFATALIARDDLPCDFSVFEGHRGKALQDTLFEHGYSKVQWPDSKHNSVPSQAVDLVPYVGGKVVWDKALCQKLAVIAKEVWASLPEAQDFDLKWGGDFKNFFDGPHYEIRPKSKP